MTGFLDLAHSLVAALIVAGASTGSAPARPALIDGPVLMAACRVHSARSDGAEQWLAAVHRSGSAAGIGALARRIFATRSGRLYAPVAEDRAAIAALADDPAVVAAIAYQEAARDAHALAARLSRRPTFAELALARRVGSDAAARLIAEAETPAGPRLRALVGRAVEHDPELSSPGGAPLGLERLEARSVSLALPRAVASIRVAGERAAAGAKSAARAGWTTRVHAASR